MASETAPMEEETIQFDSTPFQDIAPIYVEPAPICSVNYSPTFRDAMAYFRALMAADEVSPRALALTETVIRLNSADYTAWYYRQRILRSMESFDIDAEYKFVDSLAADVSKNYQVWGHRQFLVGLTKNYVNEFTFTETMLEDDNKNYHCWSHRVWVCDHFNCWPAELEFTEKMIMKDVRNNSAWSHRFYTLKKLGYLSDLDKLHAEMKLIQETFKQACNNESVWVYLNGLYDNTTDETFRAETRAFLEHIVEERQFCVYAKIVFINVFNNSPKVPEMIMELRDRLDVVHAPYWDWRLKLSSSN